jgi:hypothetical protein
MGLAWVINLQEKTRPEEGLAPDFINVYAAGMAVREGHPAEAYDWVKQRNREIWLRKNLSNGKRVVPDSFLPWFYPPMFLGIAWLEAFLPYYAALGAYLVAGLFAYGSALRKFVPPYKESVWALAAFPAVFVNLFSGQNGFITTALLTAGLYFLDESPVVAGLILGTLSYKPQFFVLIPLALALGRYWESLAACLIGAAICAGLSLAAFGLEPWRAFFDSLPMVDKISLGSDEALHWLGNIHSVFSLVRLYGGDVKTAYVVQTVVAVAAVLTLAGVWRRKKASLAVRGTSLVAALLLASPYSFSYDQVILSIPISLLAREGLENGFLSFEKTFLFGLWALPVMFRDSGEHFALPLTPPMLIGLMLLCWRRSKAELSRMS